MGNVRSYDAQKKRQYPDIDEADYVLVWGRTRWSPTRGRRGSHPNSPTPSRTGCGWTWSTRGSRRPPRRPTPGFRSTPVPTGALAMGMARWIIAHDRHDLTYLQNPSQTAAGADNEPTWSDATHLVLVDEADGQKATAADLGLVAPNAETADDYVVVDAESGDPRPASEVETAVLDVDVTVNGTSVVESVWSQYRARVFEHTVEEYAEMAGVPAEQIAEIADEFTSHGKKAAIMQYRGPAKHTNGFYNPGHRHPPAPHRQLRLEGRPDHPPTPATTRCRGATSWGTSPTPTARGDPTDPRGASTTRTPRCSTATTAIRPNGRGSPSPRPSRLREIYGSAADEYPYGINALFIRPYSNNHVMAVAGGDQIPAILQDTDTIPLVVASDTVIGETSKHADYILPEPTYLERWENFGTYPNEQAAGRREDQPARHLGRPRRPPLRGRARRHLEGDGSPGSRRSVDPGRRRQPVAA